MGKKVQYGQSNNVESARTFSAGTKRPPPKSITLKISAVKQHSDSQSGFKRVTRSFDKIQNPRHWPKAY